MSEPALSVSPDDYRAAMRHWPSGVTVVTMLDAGVPHGMTASAFTSVSVNPPLVLVVVDKRWRSHEHLLRGRVFGVSILSEEQVAVSERFAGREGDMPDRFAGLATATAVTGAPLLSDALAWLDCVLDQHHDAGDHTVFVGRVVAAAVRHAEARPLLYHNTRYRSVAHLDP